jgi:hypothetical protein
MVDLKKTKPDGDIHVDKPQANDPCNMICHADAGAKPISNQSSIS